MKKRKQVYPKAIKITVEFDDGSIRESVGEDAHTIMKHWNDCESFVWMHGQVYSGPCLKEIKKKSRH